MSPGFTDATPAAAAMIFSAIVIPIFKSSTYLYFSAAHKSHTGGRKD
jgi:hypothetical protein